LNEYLIKPTQMRYSVSAYNQPNTAGNTPLIDDNPTPSSSERAEHGLNSFDPCERAQALCYLAQGDQPRQAEGHSPPRSVNLHYHTFFSYNALGWSPSAIAWEAHKHGLLAAGIVDFDVLDGMEEFLAAGEILGLRTIAAIETRVFVREYLDQVINSPNEPGISYFMVAGCHRTPEPGTPAYDTLRRIRAMAEHRNVGVMERVNAFLDQVQLDYEADVVPLTPSGNATERHLVGAYDTKARQVFADQGDLAAFWAKSLDMEDDEAESLLADAPRLHEMIRSKLMKYGGVGYVTPAPGSFPSLEQIIELADGIGAIPTATWLDGTSPGESDMRKMLHLLASKGVAALNIIPDRNWNISDPSEKSLKLAKLAEVIEAAREVGFPICVGTEMNKAGQPFVDDFAAPELAPYIEDFVSGALFFWGHTALARRAGMGYSSDWARHYFGLDRSAPRDFYTRVGRTISPAEATLINANSLRSRTPTEVLRTLQ